MSQRINLNTTPNQFMPILYFSQGDIGRTFEIALTSSDGYSIPIGATVEMVATKPSGFGFTVSGSLTGNVATFVTTEIMTSEWGRFPAEIVIKNNGDVIGTANFYLNGERNPHPEGTIDGDASTIIPQLTLLVERVETAASSVLDRQTVTQTLPAGSQASYSFDEETNTQTFGIPQGEAGAGAVNVTASAYSSSKTYAVGDYVIHNDYLYRCTTAITTAEAFTAAHWTQVVLGDDVSDLKSALIKSYIKSNVYTAAWHNKGNNYVEGYLNSSGGVSSANDAYVTDYFEVVAGEPIIIRMDEGYTGSSIHICFYNSSKALVDYAGYSMDRRKCVGKTVPSTAKYCRFDYVKTFPNPTAEQTLSENIIPKEKNTVGTVVGEVKSTPTIVGSQSLVGFVVGWLKESDGTVTGSEALTAKYIPLLSNNPLVKWGNHAADTSTTICFYGADLSFIQTSQGRDKTIPVPAGAVYFSYSIDDSWTDADYYIMQNRNVGVPTRWQLATQGVQMGLPLNIKYRGLLAGFGNTERKLRVFGTKNFEYFEQIGLPFAPEKGNKACRDPYIMVYGDYFYIFYTDTPSFTTENNDIGICRTMDFISYEEFDPIVCNASFKVCWAPSVFEENGNYYLTITGSTLNYSETYTYMYDLDMDTLTISNERVIAVGTSTRQLDFHFEKWNGIYYAIGKYDNLTATIIGTASTLNGPYTVIANRQYSGVAEEGQQIIRLDNGAYRLYINDYAGLSVINYIDIPDITHPTENLGSLKTISDNSPVDLYHVSILDFNRPYLFENC